MSYNYKDWIICNKGLWIADPSPVIKIELTKPEKIYWYSPYLIKRQQRLFDKMLQFIVWRNRCIVYPLTFLMFMLPIVLMFIILFAIQFHGRAHGLGQGIGIFSFATGLSTYYFLEERYPVKKHNIMRTHIINFRGHE